MSVGSVSSRPREHELNWRVWVSSESVRLGECPSRLPPCHQPRWNENFLSSPHHEAPEPNVRTFRPTGRKRTNQDVTAQPSRPRPAGCVKSGFRWYCLPPNTDSQSSQPQFDDGSVYRQKRPTEVLQFILTRAKFPSGLGQLRSGRGSGVRCLASAPCLFPAAPLSPAGCCGASYCLTI